MTRRNYIIALVVTCLVAGLIVLGWAASVPAPNLHEISLGPSRVHPLGTSPDGRDLVQLSVVLAVRAVGESLWATVVTVGIGLLIGFSAAGGAGGLFDGCQSATRKVLDSVGVFVFAACLSAIAPRIGTWRLGVLLACVAWPSISEVARSEALRVSQLGYVEAARAVGVTPWRLASRHLLPPMFDRLGPHLFGIYVGFLGIFGAIDFIGTRLASEQSLGFAIFDSTTFLRSNSRYFLTCFSMFILLLLLSAGCAWGIRRLQAWGAGEAKLDR